MLPLTRYDHDFFVRTGREVNEEKPLSDSRLGDLKVIYNAIQKECSAEITLSLHSFIIRFPITGAKCKPNGSIDGK